MVGLYVLLCDFEQAVAAVSQAWKVSPAVKRFYSLLISICDVKPKCFTARFHTLTLTSLVQQRQNPIVVVTYSSQRLPLCGPVPFVRYAVW